MRLFRRRETVPWPNVQLQVEAALARQGKQRELFPDWVLAVHGLYTPPELPVGWQYVPKKGRC